MSFMSPIRTVIRFCYYQHAMLLLTLSLAVFGGAVAADDTGTKSVWPAVRKGIWETRGKRTLPNGKVQEWTMESSACTDTGHMFRGYWGLGITEAAGCQFKSARVRQTEFRITSKCMVRRVGVVESSEIVTVPDETSFSLQAVAQEGKRRYIGRKEGRWLRSCPAD
jgi:hypothetical protein